MMRNNIGKKDWTTSMRTVGRVMAGVHKQNFMPSLLLPKAIQDARMVGKVIWDIEGRVIIESTYINTSKEFLGYLMVLILLLLIML
jgi:hypothetical protein